MEDASIGRQDYSVPSLALSGSHNICMRASRVKSDSEFYNNPWIGSRFLLPLHR
jgi:hypothetical protein